MSDLISRRALLDAMPKNDELFSLDVRRVICDAPAVDATPPRWISVEERLPEGKCLAVNDCGHMMVGFISKDSYYSKETGYSCEDGDDGLLDITHWMPLPEPPKE